jgi:hypothetical protein
MTVHIHRGKDALRARTKDDIPRREPRPRRRREGMFQERAPVEGRELLCTAEALPRPRG